MILKHDPLQVSSILGMSQHNSTKEKIYSIVLLEHTWEGEDLYMCLSGKYPIILVPVVSFSKLFYQVIQQLEKCLCF